MLVDRGLEPVAFLGDALLDLRGQHLLSLAEALELLAEPSLVLVEVARPLGKARLDVLPDRGQGVAEVCARLALAFDDVPPALRCDSTLGLGERGERLRARESKRMLELGGAALELVCDDLVEMASPALDRRVQRMRVRERAAQRHDRAAERKRGDGGGGDRDDGRARHAARLGAR